MKTHHRWNPSTGEWIDLEECRRSEPDVHYVITDRMDALEHPATGKMCDSKSEFRKMTRAAGCYELGNDRADSRNMDTDRGEVTRSVLESYERAESRRND